MANRKTPYRVAFRVDGNERLGLGHLVRCANLAKLLAEDAGAKIVVFSKDAAAVEAIFADDYLLNIIPKELEEEEEIFLLFNFYQNFQPHLIINDCRDTSAAYMSKIKPLNSLLVNFDDLGTGRALSDILIDANLSKDNLPPGPIVLWGPEYIVLHPLFSQIRNLAKKTRETVSRTIVTLGGSDPANLTLKVLEALQDLPGEFEVVLGHSYPHIAQLAVLAGQLRSGFTFHRGLETLAPLLNEVDLAFVAGGITLYETFCLGVPAIVLAQLEHQEVIAQRFAKKGMLVYLGPGSMVTREQIRAAYLEILENSSLRQSLSEKGRQLVDGQGLARIYKQLSQSLNKRFA